ncbi:MAG: CPBP family intramembrane metalloprotease [Kaistella sp.]|nr:CPBP family intramembrane metalloprotease [Kaistella sp.]
MIKDISTEIRKFLQFLKSPKYSFSDHISLNDKYRIFTVLFFAVLILNMAVIIPLLSYVDEQFLKIESLSLFEYTIGTILLFAVIIAPVLEELVFRFPLKYERNYVFRFVDKITGRTFFSQFWKNNFSLIFYTVALLFGFAHSLNFKNDWTPLFLLLLPLLVLSQSVTGIFLGYIRLRLGFIWSVLFHMCFNLVVILIPYLIYDHAKIIDQKKPNYEIKVIGLFCKDSNISTIVHNKAGTKIFMIESTNMELQSVLDLTLERKWKLEDTQMVHFHLKSDKGITEAELVKILDQEFEIVPVK